MQAPLRSVYLAFTLVIWTSVALGQPPFGGPPGGGDSTMLLRQESVQKELKLTPEQINKVEDLSENIREKFREVFEAPEEERGKKMQELRKENEKAVAQILKPEQVKRLKQISYQRQGSRAFTDTDVAKALQLTDEQQKKIREINEEAGRKMRELFQPGMPPDDETRQKITELQKASADRIMKLLTEAQKTKWKELQGEPFKGEIRFGPPGPPRQ
jgi:Spy/CpxP family protein refolding chaperone